MRIDIDIVAAREYNFNRSGDLWNRRRLPWPLSSQTPAGECFVFLVAVFQRDHGLRIDGKLGPATLSSIRAIESEGSRGDSDDALEDGGLPIVPARTAVSNQLIVAGKPVAIPQSAIDAGITVSNFAADDEHRFAPYARRCPVKLLVLHESVTRTAPGVVRVLEAKRARSIRDGRNGGRGHRYGVHLIAAPDGHVSQHADLADDWLVHANQANRSAIGWEIVNPYTARKPRPPFARTIPRQWWTWVPRGAPPAYTLPTEAQLLAVEHLVPFICSLFPDLPLAFPTQNLGPSRPRISGWDRGALPDPGVVAHRDFSSHADGRYLLEVLIRRVVDLAAA